VLNKIDRLSADEAASINANHNSARVSALTGEGLQTLLGLVDQAMPVDPVLRLRFSLPLANGRAIALVHALGRVLRSEVQDSALAMEAEIPESVARQLKISFEPSAA
jgi:50S ribosomal subunit-associated GTPase HflX